MDIVLLEGASELKKYGGKAASLAKMIQFGATVPPGFVLSADSGKLATELKNELLSHFDSLGAKFVAVRSSALGEDGSKASWAGQLETVLNVTRETLIEAVWICKNSLNSTRAKAYQESSKISLGKVGVIVQTMIQSEVSGVAFSVHPVTHATDQIVIEAVYGLGEALVSGAVTPDTYVTNKDTGDIIEKHLGTQAKQLIKDNLGKNVWQTVGMKTAGQQKLQADQIKAISEITVQLEQFFGYSVDIEWAFADTQLYVLQCRPITTLG